MKKILNTRKVETWRAASLLYVFFTFFFLFSGKAQNHWNPDITQYDNYMAIAACILFNGVELEDVEDEQIEIGGFIDDVCRGTYRLYDMGYPGHPFPVFLQVWGSPADNGKPITFKLYDHATATEYTAEQTPAYQYNGLLGYPTLYEITVIIESILGGVVSITGNTVFDETLTANTIELTANPMIPDLGELIYQWQRGETNIADATHSTYTLVQADIGSTITLVVTAANCSGSVISYPTAEVTKAVQTAPVTPTLNDVTATTIILNTIAGCEYNINGGDYQSSPTFAGLTPETNYTFTQRKAETATHLASPESPEAIFTTEETTVPLYTIVSSVNNPVFGNITPYGEAKVQEGGDIEFTITAFTGYEIDDVWVNGISTGKVESFKFENVHTDGTITAMFKKTVGITNYELQIMVYPNPTTGELRVQSSKFKIQSIVIFDVYGRNVVTCSASQLYPETKFPSNSLEGWQPQADGVVVNISHLPNGIYFLQTQTERGVVTKKIAKH